MRITRELLRPPSVPRWRYACRDGVEKFCRLHPDGCEPTVEALSALEAKGFDVWWLVRLLPLRQLVEYALWCADPDGAHQYLDPARRWAGGGPVTLEELRASARGAAWEAEKASAAAAEAEEEEAEAAARATLAEEAAGVAVAAKAATLAEAATAAWEAAAEAAEEEEEEEAARAAAETAEAEAYTAYTVWAAGVRAARAAERDRQLAWLSAALLDAL